MSAGTRSSDALRNGITWGVVGGMAGAAVMAMYAMVVSATVKDVGFFTPMYHIASTFLSPKTMMQSMQAAAGGDAFTFSAGPAIVGLLIHMVTGAMAGAVFGAVAAVARPARGVTLVAGAAFGLLVLVVNSFVGLPIAASLFGGGDVIRHMPRMVGWGTFTVEHVLYGVALGAVVAAALRDLAPANRLVRGRVTA